jgi:hypothetical protein
LLSLLMSDLFPVGWEIPGDNQKSYSILLSHQKRLLLLWTPWLHQSVEKILKNLGVKCNFANNWVFRPGEFQAENESER